MAVLLLAHHRARLDLPGPKNCFPAGTLVHTSLGQKPIERIVVGERVFGFDHHLKEWTEQEVVETYQLVHRGVMATLEVAGESIGTTGGHPVWVVRGTDLAHRPAPGEVLPKVPGSCLDGRWV